MIEAKRVEARQHEVRKDEGDKLCAVPMQSHACEGSLADSLSMNDVARVEVIKGHQQLCEPAHDHVLAEV